MIADNGGTAYPIRIDMTDADAVISAVEEAENAVGTVTIAVNNAGVPDAQTRPQNAGRVDRPGARDQSPRSVHPRL
jgi:NAD(P)-dependent dehydrogenase (short-subunit alcohol dehydrogenase family)